MHLTWGRGQGKEVQQEYPRQLKVAQSKQKFRSRLLQKSQIELKWNLLAAPPPNIKVEVHLKSEMMHWFRMGPSESV